MYFSRLNYKYLEIYHEIIKHVIWLGRKIEVNMVLDLCEKILWIICRHAYIMQLPELPKLT